MLHTRSLTENPFRLLAKNHLCQFIRHIVETLRRINNEVDRFETFTQGPINREFRNLELQIKMLIPYTYQ